MQIYVVEAQSNSTRICPFSGDDYYDTVRAHIASTLAGARKFCRTHSDWAGDRKKTYNYNPGYGFVSWHWRIKRITVDEDGCCTVGGGYYVEERTPSGRLIRKTKW